MKVLKRPMRHVSIKQKILFGLCIIFLVTLLFFQYTTWVRNSIYEEFTCSCCETSLQDSTCLMAGGMRASIDETLRDNFYSKSKTLLDAVKTLGIPLLKDDEKQIEYGLAFAEDPPTAAPSLTIEPKLVELGTVSNSRGLILVDFTVINNGTEDLTVYDLKTSCSCVDVSFIKEGQESIRAGRFSSSDGWTYVIKPKEEVLLRAHYDPRITNWQTGHVERLITLTSNDPIYFRTSVKISAELVP